MKATELRIGNWAINFLGQEFQVNHETLRMLSVGGSGSEFPSPKPIPLTEEWHNKFGVELNGFRSFEYKLPRKNNIDMTVVFQGDYVFLKQGDNIKEIDIVSIWNRDLTKRDMYVNEWQNLYHALTGEELKINE